jgi:hypothetical protein
METSTTTNKGSKKKWRQPANSARFTDVGRHRKWAADDISVLSFKVEGELIRLLDEEAKTFSAEQPAGRAAISRGELVRILLHEGLAAHAAARSKPRQ